MMTLRMEMSRLLATEFNRRRMIRNRSFIRPAASALVVFLLASVGAFSVSASNKVETVFKEADALRSSDPAKFEESLVRLESLAKQATPLQLQKIEYLRAYRSAMYADQFDNAISQAKSLYGRAKSNELRFRAATLIANTSAIKRDFATGLKYMGLALDLRNQVKEKSIKHNGVNGIAILYNQMGQFSLGRQYANEVLRDAPAPRQKCFASNIVLESDQRLGSAIADNRFESAIEECIRANEPVAINMTRAFWAIELAEVKQYPRALTILETALPEVQATRYPRLIAGFHSVLAEIKLNLGDVKAAEEHAKATVALGEAIASSEPLVSAYKTLYQIASTREKPSVALDLYKRYAESEMAHQSDVRARELAYEIVRHETQQKNKEIVLLQRNNQVLRLQQTLERESAQKARLAMVFLMLVLAGIIFWAIQIKRHQGQLQRLAQTDTLTGLGNRHYFTKKSERALIDAARAGESAALVMFDLDHFKAINDTYGHGAGDWVLKQVGKTCSAHCRKVDYLGRIGGEEFAVLLHGLDLSTATRLAEDCRSQLAQLDTRECGYSFVVTASFGVSSTAQSGYDLSRLLSHADQMLYRAKNEGRNRVCAYTAETAADYKSTKRSPTLSVVSS